MMMPSHNAIVSAIRDAAESAVNQAYKAGGSTDNISVSVNTRKSSTNGQREVVARASVRLDFESARKI